MAGWAPLDPPRSPLPRYHAPSPSPSDSCGGADRRTVTIVPARRPGRRVRRRDAATMSDLSPASRRYIVGIVVTAVLATTAAFWADPPHERDAWLGLVFGAGMLLAWRFPI